MWKQLIAIVFIIAFVGQTFNKPFIMMDYYANTAAYAKNCINKARPKLNCNGKCQMMKKLQQEEKKEAEKEALKGQYKIDIFSNNAYSFKIAAPFFILKSMLNADISATITDRSYSFFRPPQV